MFKLATAFGLIFLQASFAHSADVGEWTTTDAPYVGFGDNTGKQIESQIGECQPDSFADIAAFTIQPGRASESSFYVFCKQGNNALGPVMLARQLWESPKLFIRDTLRPFGNAVVIGVALDKNRGDNLERHFIFLLKKK